MKPGSKQGSIVTFKKKKKNAASKIVICRLNVMGTRLIA